MRSSEVSDESGLLDRDGLDMKVSMGMYVPGRRSRGRPRGHEERMQRNRLRCGDP